MRARTTTVSVSATTFKNIAVDLAYTFIKFDQRKAVGTEINFDGTYNSTANMFAVNFGYSF